MFALKHTQYVRWLSVFLRYLEQFHNKNHQLFEWFQSELVTMNMSDKVFLNLVIDQGREYKNELVKSV